MPGCDASAALLASAWSVPHVPAGATDLEPASERDGVLHLVQLELILLFPLLLLALVLSRLGHLEQVGRWDAHALFAKLPW